MRLRNEKGVTMKARWLSRVTVFALVLFVTANGEARTWHVKSDATGDAPTVQAGIDSSTAGDTVLVSCGTYYEHDLVMKSGVCLRGESNEPPCATIDAQHQGTLISCMSTGSSTRIEGITFTKASLRSMLVYGWVTVRDCVFADNGREVVDIHYAAPEFYDCVFYGNGFSTPSYTVFCVFAGANPLFKNCTFVNNCAGIYAAMDSFPLIENCIIAYCQSISLYGYESGFSINCSDLYGNGDAENDSAVVNNFPSCFIADPQFCGISGSGNFYLQSDSPCAPGNHPDGSDCGIIGALPVLCGSVKTETRTWGSVKALYGE
jgi:hypothetical protein